MIIRNEQPDDFPALRHLITDAFRVVPFSRGTEAAILDALRAAGALTLSLVATEASIAGKKVVLGHVAFSPVTIGGRDGPVDGWYGVGPLAVRPDRQRGGIGQALMRAGLARIRALGGRGCVLAGDPAYYGRLGFAARPGLCLPDVPAEVFLALPLDGVVPAGTVTFHPAFAAEAEPGTS